jgi:hypothetical protein
MNFEISHAVDDSDIAFVMRLDRKSTVCSMMSSRSTHYHKVGTNIDAFVNLATVNYLLAGLQLCYSRKHNGLSGWFQLLHDLDQERYPEPGVQLTLWDLRYIVRELIVPFGVVRGSEKQGGQDETGLAAATWPVNFVCNMVLDGHDRNVLNYWAYHDVSAGDDLVFRLKPMPIPKGKNGYTLNHYYKGFCQQNFESYFLANLGHPYATHVWQLVPDVFSLDCKFENDRNHGANSILMSPGFEVPRDYVWQEHGFWHIARSQVMIRKYALAEYYNDDMANQMKTSHLDVTFEPTYTKVPGETRDPADGRAIHRDGRPTSRRPPGPAAHTGPRDARNVAPGMMGPPAPRTWAPQLFLEGAAFEEPPAEAAAAPVARRFDLDIALSEDSGLGRRQREHELDRVLMGDAIPRPSKATRGPELARRSAPVDYTVIFRPLPSVPSQLSTDADLDAGMVLDPPFMQAPEASLSTQLPDEDYSLVFSDPMSEPPAARAAATGQGKGGRKRRPQEAGT